MSAAASLLCHVNTHLHQSTLHVTRLGGLDSGIDQTFTTRDGVEQELGRREAGKETISDESAGAGLAILLRKVGERPVLEAVADTGSRNNLLTDAGDHLCDVDLGTYNRVVSANLKATESLHQPLDPQVAITKGAFARLNSAMQISPTAARTPESTPEIKTSSVAS